MSVSRETAQTDHIIDLMTNGLPLVFFDRVCEEIETAKITTDDFECGYKATQHLIKQGCNRIGFLGISKCLSISKTRLDGYLKALQDSHIEVNNNFIIHCNNEADQNDVLIKDLLQLPERPDGIVATVEKLTTPVYEACTNLYLNIPGDLKFVCFSNLETATILNPSLTTITQPAFEMGKTAAALLFNALENSDFNLAAESMVISSELVIRNSTRSN